MTCVVSVARLCAERGVYGEAKQPLLPLAVCCNKEPLSFLLANGLRFSEDHSHGLSEDHSHGLGEDIRMGLVKSVRTV